MTDHLRSHRRDADLLPAREPAREEEQEAWPGKHSLVDELQASSGQELPEALRRQLERVLASDLAAVRIHTDRSAEKATTRLHAKAFTIGQAIYFNRGFFDPSSTTGRRLIAHEVAHTVQQRGAQVAPTARVSTPGDRHEVQAESFSDAFVAGRRGPQVTPVSRGVVARAVIQRDLLDGGVPAGLAQGPVPIQTQEPTPAELTQQARTALRTARQGGTSQVVAIVRQLRANSTPTTRDVVESAILAELNDEEKAAVNGGGAQAPRPTQGNGNNPPPPNSPPPGQPPTARTSGPQPAGSQPPGTQPAQAPGGPPAGAQPAGAPPATQTAQPAGPAGAQPAGQQPAGQQPAGQQPAGAQPAGAQPRGQQPGPQPAAQTAPPAAAPAEPTVEERAAAVPPAAGRALIEAELAFHDRWRALSQGDGDGAGNRVVSAGTRFAALMEGAPGDIAQGVKGGVTQYLFGQTVQMVAQSKLLGRVPGIGNIIGGGFAAYNLFSHGGAGIREITKDIGEGIGGAFNAQNWRDSPFLTAANLIAGIKAALELVGNFAQILSGLAYAFAAIAALGGLLSVFFPPLALLLPYIPVALQFGRACGGVATVCLAVASGLSPIPPILRAIHIIFSSNDPITLVGEEEKFHKEAQGAIANYSSSRLQNRTEMNENPNNPGRSFYGGLRNDINTGAGAVRTSVGSGTTRNTAAGLGTSPEELRVAQTQAAVGGQTSDAQRLGREYFNPDGRTAANTANTQSAEQRLSETQTRQQGRQATADAANQSVADNNTRQNRRTAERAQGKLDEANERVSTAERGVERAQTRAEMGGRHESTGNSGDLGGAALDREMGARDAAASAPRNMSVDQAAQTMQPQAEATPVQRNARGHIRLPPPPSTLAAIDALDRQIEEARQGEAALRQNAAAARQSQTQATQTAAGLRQSSQGVTQFLGQQQQRGSAAQQRIAAQTTDMQSRSAQANQQSTGQTTQASSTLATVAGAARTVDGFLGNVPNNRFFDISSTRTNVHRFVLGMDSVTQAGPQQREQQGQVTAVTAQRQQQTDRAAQSNAAGVTAGQQVQQMMSEDAAIATTASSQAAEIAAGSTARAQQEQSSAAQLTQQRQQRWAALLDWAAQHRAMRAQATPGGGS